METGSSVRKAMCTVDWICSVDLQDAYIYVSIHPASYWHLQLAVSQAKSTIFAHSCFHLDSEGISGTYMYMYEEALLPPCAYVPE